MESIDVNGMQGQRQCLSYSLNSSELFPLEAVTLNTVYG